jgi:hypothetical protein
MEYSQNNDSDKINKQTHLIYCDSHNNQFTGSLPSELGHLVN